MDATHIESKVAQDVSDSSRLLVRSSKLAELPITALFSISDLVLLELALDRFAQVHISSRSKRLVDTVRGVLSVARTRFRVAGAIRQAVSVAEARPGQ
jgi:hypothetical protein